VRSVESDWDDLERQAAPNPDHTPYHPRWHRERIPIFWWAGNRRYVKFIARELTAVLVLYTALLLLAFLVVVDRGPEAYAAFQGWLARPWVLALHIFVLAGLLFHTVTWLNLAPKALVLRMGSLRVPPRFVLAGHYLAWFVLSAVVVGVLFMGVAG
jgi:fumarate reductase subunit C